MQDFTLQVSPEQSTSLRDIVYNKLRTAILFGHFEPGRQLNERELAGAMGLSTTPVKEALRRLEVEGLAVSRPRRGTFVSQFAKTNLEELAHIRAALEGVAARYAATKVCHEAIHALERQLRIMETLTAEGPSTNLARANFEFHRIIHKTAQNAYLSNLAGAMSEFDHFFRGVALSTDVEARQALEDHKTIGAAVMDGNADLAEAMMKHHIVRTAGVVREYVARNNATKADTVLSKGG